jgi:diguanylate cyclase (GGDEF)-like protein/PAS domain S-box-containing protein
LYRTKPDLLEILVPYFQCGLEHNEFCVWVTSDPLTIAEAEAAMRAAMPGLDDAARKGQIEIISYADCYLQDGRFDSDLVLACWLAKLETAQARGYDGVRVTGDTSWLERALWRDFAAYEDAADRMIGNRQVIDLCTYSLERCSVLDIIDVAMKHRFVLVKQHQTWTLVEPSGRRSVALAIDKANQDLIHDLRSAQRYTRSLIEASLDPLVTIEPGGTITDVNVATEHVTGCSRAELVGTEFSAYFADPGLARAGYERVFRDGTVRDYPLDLRHLDGHTTPVLYNASVYRDDAGQVLGVFAAARDITERKRAEQQLAHRASHDDLTDLPNRTLLLEYLAGALARSRRTGSPVGVLFLDLDDFKSINDSYGHSAGDELLTQVAARISTSIRASDVVTRVGGDEFVIICENLKESSDAALVADQIQRALTGQIPLRGQSVTAGASVGIAFSQRDSSPESMLRDADAAMYVAKKRGGRRWEPADESLHAAAIRVLAVEGELRRALERRELRVYYQPLIDLATETIVAVEALLRWQHPDRGLLLPADFVDVAEQRGLIGDIGTWVLRTACDQVTIWRRQYGPTAPGLAVNVSSRQLDHQGIGTHITQALDVSQLPADNLFLEVTESQLLAASTSSMNDLRTLAARGIRIAVDDFGTGHAGFDYLRCLPVQELKIDRSFIDGTGNDPTDTAITASIVTLGLSLGLTVVAEGIETHRQLHTLRDLGCTWGQGWLWHPALPADDIDALLAAR